MLLTLCCESKTLLGEGWGHRNAPLTSARWLAPTAGSTAGSFRRISGSSSMLLYIIRCALSYVYILSCKQLFSLQPISAHLQQVLVAATSTREKMFVEANDKTGSRKNCCVEDTRNICRNYENIGSQTSLGLHFSSLAEASHINKGVALWDGCQLPSPECHI